MFFFFLAKAEWTGRKRPHIETLKQIQKKFIDEIALKS